MRFKFFSHLIVMLALNLLVKPLAIFAIDAEVQNRVGSEAYGEYFALLSFTYLFNILLDLGLTNYNTKRVAHRPDKIRNSLAQLLPLRIGLLLLYVLLSLVLALALGYSGSSFDLLAWLILNQFLISFTLFFRSYFNGLLLFKTEILFSVLDKLLLVLGVGWVLYGTDWHLSIRGFVLLQTASYALTFLLALILVVKHSGFAWKLTRLKHYRSILSQTLPYALLIVFMMIYQRADAVWLERLLHDGGHQTGIYAQAYRILDALFMFAGMFSGLLFPLFSKMYREKTDVVPLLESASRVLLAGAMLIAAISWFYAPVLLKVLYEHDLASSAPVFVLLMLAFVPMCVIVLCGTLLTARGNLRFLNLTSFGGIVVNSVVNYLLIPEYGAYGAAWACVATQSVVAIVQLWYVFFRAGIPVKMTELLRYVGLVVIMLFSGYLIVTWDASWLGLLLLSAIGLIYVLATHLLPWKFLLSLKKNNS